LKNGIKTTNIMCQFFINGNEIKFIRHTSGEDTYINTIRYYSYNQKFETMSEQVSFYGSSKQKTIYHSVSKFGVGEDGEEYLIYCTSPIEKGAKLHQNNR